MANLQTEYRAIFAAKCKCGKIFAATLLESDVGVEAAQRVGDASFIDSMAHEAAKIGGQVELVANPVNIEPCVCNQETLDLEGV